MTNLSHRIDDALRVVPDFPSPGISFKDISTLFLDPVLVEDCTHAFIEHWKGKGINKVLGIDSRGFLFGPQIAQALGAGFVMIRKKDKLPPETISVAYELEYGEASIEVVRDAIRLGDRVMIHDDLLATGGTAAAAAQLAGILGAEILGFSFVINLDFLNGKNRLSPFSSDIQTLLNLDS